MDLRENMEVFAKDFYEFIENLPTEHKLKKFMKKQSDTPEVNKFVFQTTQTFATLNNNLLCKRHREWINKKIEEIKKDDNQSSSVLGEFRAYYHLARSNFGNLLQCSQMNGSDFFVKTNDNIKINIEVNTPEGASKNKTNNIGISKNKKIITEISEEAPFGFPERKQDTFFSEFCSAINSIKQDEHQFEKESINILWIDFVNPFLENMNLFNRKLCQPFTLFQNQIHAGDIWFALYSKKSESVPTNFSLDWGCYRDYKMEYNGRLVNGESIIDFIIFNLYDGLFVFENLYDHNVDKTDEIYKFLYSMNINLEDSWLNFPTKNLKKNVQQIKERRDAYKNSKEKVI